MSERVNYDRVAPLYESRYQRNDYSGVERAVASFVEVTRGGSGRVLEVGCGGGHWLRTLADAGIVVFGLDPSEGMLTVARSSVGPRCLTRGRAETLPYAEASYDRLFCVNALHHVEDPAAFVREARRVLRP